MTAAIAATPEVWHDLRSTSAPSSVRYHSLRDAIAGVVDDEGIDELEQDIRAHGLIEPIVLYEDRILDGRRRQIACERAGVEPDYDEYVGTSPAAFFVSRNIYRRHLTVGQRAMIAQRLLPELKRESEARRRAGGSPRLLRGLGEHGRATEHAARLVGVGSRTVEAAARVEKNGSDLLREAVMSGRLSVSAASRLAELPRKKQNTVLRKGKVVTPPPAAPSLRSIDPAARGMLLGALFPAPVMYWRRALR